MTNPDSHTQKKLICIKSMISDELSLIVILLVRICDILNENKISNIYYA